MSTRRYVIAATLGSATGAALFLLALDRALEGEHWGRAALTGILFGLFMAGYNSVLIRLDSRQRTPRNIHLVTRRDIRGERADELFA